MSLERCTQVRRCVREGGRSGRSGRSVLEGTGPGSALERGSRLGVVRLRRVGLLRGLVHVRRRAVAAARGLAVGLGADALLHRGGQGPGEGPGETAGVVACAVALVLVLVVAAAAVAVTVMSPSAVHSARKPVTKAFHNFMTLIWAMAPHFQVGRFAYFPHDVYGGGEVVDRRPWRVDVLMNTTRMGA